MKALKNKLIPILVAFAIGFIIMLIAGCDINYAKDGYKFEGKEVTREYVNVRFVEHKNLHDLQTKAEQYGLNKKTSVEAFNVYRPSTNTCDVHILNPEINYKPENIGHEVAHCIYGEWHPKYTASLK